MFRSQIQKVGSFRLDTPDKQTVSIYLKKNPAAWSIQLGEGQEFEYFQSRTIVSVSVKNNSHSRITLMGLLARSPAYIEANTSKIVFRGSLNTLYEKGANIAFDASRDPLDLIIGFRVESGFLDKGITVNRFESFK